MTKTQLALRARTQVQASNNALNTGSERMYIGVSDNNENYNGIIGEIIYYNRELSEEERHTVTDFLTHKWLEGELSWSCTLNQCSTCTSCNDGYHLEGSTCVLNECTCELGVNATGT